MAELALFPVLVLALVWVPGAVILDLSRVRVRPLDDVALSLTAGTAAAAAAYWLTARLGLRDLFLVWPVLALAAASVGWRRQRERLLAFRDAFHRKTTLVPIALVLLSLVPYTFLPLFIPTSARCRTAA